MAETSDLLGGINSSKTDLNLDEIMKMTAGRLTADHLRGQVDRYFHDLEHLDSTSRKYLKGYVRSNDR